MAQFEPLLDNTTEVPQHCPVSCLPEPGAVPGQSVVRCHLSLSGREVGLFDVPAGQQPLGAWLPAAVSDALGRAPRGVLQLIDAEAHIFWSEDAVQPPEAAPEGRSQNKVLATFLFCASYVLPPSVFAVQAWMMSQMFQGPTVLAMGCGGATLTTLLLACYGLLAMKPANAPLLTCCFFPYALSCLMGIIGLFSESGFSKDSGYYRHQKYANATWANVVGMLPALFVLGGPALVIGFGILRLKFEGRWE